MGAHALLSASASDRWLNCPPSARLTEYMPDTGSPYAVEGSLAHEIAEVKIRKHFLEPMGVRAFNNQVKKIKERYAADVYKEEMQRHTTTYLDYIAKIALSYESRPYVAVEKKIDYSSYAPEGFGTCDCILIGGKEMHIIDFKYGKGVPVSAGKQHANDALRPWRTHSLLDPLHDRYSKNGDCAAKAG